ncbi:hypothetical protein ACFL5Z_10020 [Planctomycetota bacterium]
MGKEIGIEKQLKEALQASDMSRKLIVKKSRGKLSEAQLSYLITGKRSLTLHSAAILAKVLGLELKPIEKEEVKHGKHSK